MHPQQHEPRRVHPFRDAAAPVTTAYSKRNTTTRAGEPGRAACMLSRVRVRGKAASPDLTRVCGSFLPSKS
nr:MAG TPA: hypothetical protein [Caudoviricetes sp.]